MGSLIRSKFTINGSLHIIISRILSELILLGSCTNWVSPRFKKHSSNTLWTPSFLAWLLDQLIYGKLKSPRMTVAAFTLVKLYNKSLKDETPGINSDFSYDELGGRYTKITLYLVTAINTSKQIKSHLELANRAWSVVERVTLVHFNSLLTNTQTPPPTRTGRSERKTWYLPFWSIIGLVMQLLNQVSVKNASLYCDEDKKWSKSESLFFKLRAFKSVHWTIELLWVDLSRCHMTPPEQKRCWCRVNTWVDTRWWRWLRRRRRRRWRRRGGGWRRRRMGRCGGRWLFGTTIDPCLVCGLGFGGG